MTSTLSPSFCMTTFSASPTNLTLQSHDCSCYVSRPILAPPPLTAETHWSSAHDCGHSTDLWHPPMPADTCASRWRVCGINPAIRYCHA